MDKRLVIIDGNSLMNRAFYALPDLMNKEGLHTNAIYGFTTMLFKIIDNYNPTHISVAFDLKAPTFRHKQYEDYKAGRKKMPDELRVQVQPLKELLDAFKIHRLEIEGFEADDIIGTVSQFAEKEGFEVFIVTGDKDAIQLASDNTKVLITRKGLSELEEYDYNEVLKRYELTPDQFIDLKGLMGDKSDNIPGVPGIGEKTGIKLLKEFESIENLIQNTDKLKGSVKKKIEENIDIALMSKRLATIIRNIPVEIDVDDLKLEEYDEEKIIKLFNKFGFNSLIGRINSNQGNRESVDLNVKYLSFKEMDELIDEIKNKKYMTFKTVSKEGELLDENIIYLFITLDGENIYYIKEKEGILKLKEVLESKDIKKYGYKLKEDYIALRNYDINLKNINFDIVIAEYLIDATSSNYSYDNIAAKYIGRKVISEEELLGKGKKAKKYEDLDENTLTNYFSSILNVVVNVKDKMEDKIKEYKMETLFYNVEIPLIEVLGYMEHEGFKVDVKKLEDLKEEYTLLINNLQNDIYNLAGEEFNINSPKQLGVVLFEKLNLPIIKKTKTGYSTNAEVLEKLKNEHPIIEKISEYRQIVKLKTTYVDGLLNIINKRSGRIHSSFNQTITTTGRISSTEPNLQNIPVRLEMGRNLRKVFISKENYTLLDADYSQIELRVLAHISEDKDLINAFLSEEDIHTSTAAKVFNVDIKDVTSEMRSAAKAVNFGIVYGISDFGLSQNLSISVKKAKEYIDSYFNKYPKVKEYMERVVDDAKKDGYVTTILNRRRYIPEINSKNFVVKNLGKRLAMNTPIQGSAADVIKIAMVSVFNKLNEKNLKSKLILQVHDELIIEAHEDEVDVVKDILKTEMEKAVELTVPLKVDLNSGKSWYETK
ncbi:DNA polymerase I [Tepidibacter formicigenes]|uniref:DNA polymerase I n=1 Tax=Tepidibacter formicigenes DSM 15518 TaxID=1123349 RepID=A0A1M6K566_9FIRM|nr:DNA polymerase I [Tepidibacter formicigenes]SHJ54116.1 DNA polymerase I [Tepidibacter formicigenes DSM 15518]